MIHNTCENGQNVHKQDGTTVTKNRYLLVEVQLCVIADLCPDSWPKHSFFNSNSIYVVCLDSATLEWSWGRVSISTPKAAMGGGGRGFLASFFGFVCVMKMKLTCKLYETREVNEEKGVFSYQFWLGL